MVGIEGLVTNRGRDRELKGSVIVTMGLLSFSPMGLTVSVGSILPTHAQSLYGVLEEVIGR